MAGSARIGEGSETPGDAAFVFSEEESPKDFVLRRMEELRAQEKPVVFGRKQRKFLALVTRHVASVVEAEKRKKLGEQAEAAVEQRVFLLCGQGGSGKTEVTKICREMFVKFFGPGSEVAMAYSNSAARVLGGDTIHSCLHMHGETGLDLESLSKGVTPELMDSWRDVKAALIDEVSLVFPRLLGAASYRMCLGRRGEAKK